MPTVIADIFSLFGYLLRAVGFLVIGLALGRFLLDSYKKAIWQLQIALVLGFFGLLIALTDFSSAGSAGAFALGAGISLWTAYTPKKEEEPEEKK